MQNTNLRIIIVDTHKIKLKDIKNFKNDWIISTNPIVTQRLRSLKIQPTIMEDLLSTSDLIAVHVQVESLLEFMKKEFEEYHLSSDVPNAIQVDIQLLSFHFFSLLCKVQELNRIFDLTSDQWSDAKKKSVYLFTDQKEIRSTIGILNENDNVYCWLLYQFSKLHSNLQLNIIFVNRYIWSSIYVSTLAGYTQAISKIQKLGLSLFNPFYLYKRFYRKKSSEIPIDTSKETKLLLGRRRYELSHLSNQLLDKWHMRWSELDDIVYTDYSKETVWKKNRDFENYQAKPNTNIEIALILHNSMQAELDKKTYRILAPIIEPLSLRMSNIISQHYLFQEFLIHKKPDIFLSSFLSADPIDRLLALLCRRLNIPVIGIQHGGSYGDFGENYAQFGYRGILNELELCDHFVAWGTGTVETLLAGQSRYLTRCQQTSIHAGSPLSIASPVYSNKNIDILSRPLQKVLYIPHNIAINIVRGAWLRDRYVDHVISMCELLTHHSNQYHISVKLHLTNHWDEFLFSTLNSKFSRLKFIVNTHTVTELAQDSDFIVIDHASTLLCQTLPYLSHIALVEPFAELYPGRRLIGEQALELLKKRCIVASSFAELRAIVEGCLTRKEHIQWPDISNTEYFYKFVKTNAPDEYEIYRRILNDSLTGSTNA